MMANANTNPNANANISQVVPRNEPDRNQEQNPPQVRKISRFQVSHVKEEDKVMKATNIVHGGDVLRENISPEQQKQPQMAHEMGALNIHPPNDNSPDKIDVMVYSEPQKYHIHCVNFI